MYDRINSHYDPKLSNYTKQLYMPNACTMPLERMPMLKQ